MIPTLFENDDILAVDKPEGLASIPESEKGKDCLLSLLSSAFPAKLYVVHRLDKEVSGVILFAKNPAAHKYLNDQFSKQGIRKTYLALTHGVIPETGSVIDKPLHQFGSGRMGVDPLRGRPSATEFHVRERFGAYTLVEVQPLTGRRHQIRVHFYSIGHPIVGDLRYGDRVVQRTFPRMMLHAQEIALRLPSGEEVTIEASVPESFKLVIDKVG
jgi:tRNA pseudouridine32 synthase/23S rRNA pseudouridine746 synthase